MRELRTYGSVGALGGIPPRATRTFQGQFHVLDVVSVLPVPFGLQHQSDHRERQVALFLELFDEPDILDILLAVICHVEGCFRGRGEQTLRR